MKLRIVLKNGESTRFSYLTETPTGTIENFAIASLENNIMIIKQLCAIRLPSGIPCDIIPLMDYLEVLGHDDDPDPWAPQ